jgi:hypothetical protein
MRALFPKRTHEWMAVCGRLDQVEVSHTVRTRIATVVEASTHNEHCVRR